MVVIDQGGSKQTDFSLSSFIFIQSIISTDSIIHKEQWRFMNDYDDDDGDDDSGSDDSSQPARGSLTVATRTHMSSFLPPRYIMLNSSEAAAA